MLYTNEINEIIAPPWNAVLGEARCKILRDQLEAFVRGGPISIAQNPRKAKLAYMSRLHSTARGIWDIRSRGPRPGIRVLGAFSEPDVFIALSWHRRGCLGEYGSFEWEAAIKDAQAKWDSIIKYAPVITPGPLSKEIIHERYISENFDLIGGVNG